MFQLDNITVKELYLSEDINGYFELQKIMKPKPEFGKHKAKELTDLAFDDVSKIKRVMLKPTYDGLFQVFQLVFGVRKLQYEMASVVDYFYALNHLKSEIKKIVEREKKMLTSDPDPMMSMAGSDRLNMFGELNTLKKLGMDFGKSPEEIGQWSYSLVFALTLHDKIHGEVEKRYYELKRPKKRGYK